LKSAVAMAGENPPAMAWLQTRKRHI
jgi:hypothetical protein